MTDETLVVETDLDAADTMGAEEGEVEGVEDGDEADD